MPQLKKERRHADMAKIIGKLLQGYTVGGITVTKNGVVRENVPHRKRSLSRKAMRSKCIIRGLMSIYPIIKEQLMGTLEGCKHLGEASNKFVSLNCHRTAVWIPHELKKSGASFVVDYAVSQGSLYRIKQKLTTENQLCTDIAIADDITVSTTIGQLSIDIIAHNPHFAKGDILKLFYVEQHLVCTPQIPQVVCMVDNLCLNPDDAELLTHVTGSRPWCRHGGFLAMAEPLSNAAAAYIHVRVTSSGQLYASSQELHYVNPIVEPYTTEEAFEHAYQSYCGKKA